MVEYHFKPREKKQQDQQQSSKISEHWTSGNTADGASKSKLGVAIALVVLAFVFVAGPKITGFLFYEDPEYTQLSKLPDFPQLTKEKANIGLYNCRGDLSDMTQKSGKCDSDLSASQKLYGDCTAQKDEVSNNLQATTDNYNLCINQSRDYTASAENLTASLRFDIDACNAEKTVKDTNLGSCNTALEEKQASLTQMIEEKDEIVRNYANSVCCTLKKLGNPALKYYNLVDNKVFCSESEGTEFAC